MSDEQSSAGGAGRAGLFDLPARHHLNFSSKPPPPALTGETSNQSTDSALESCTAEEKGALLPLLDLSVLEGPAPLERQWALQDYIPASETTLFTGPGGVGKSLLGQQLATCIAADVPLLGVQTRGSAALYVSCEDDNDELIRRQLRICAALNVGDLKGRLHLSSLRGLLGNELCSFDDRRRLKPSARFESLARTIQLARVQFVALDNVGHFFIGNENDRGEVTQFVNLLNKLAQDEDCTVLLLGHPNKSGDSYSGSTAWLNAVRSQMELNWAKDGDALSGDPDLRRLSLGKANYAPNGTSIEFRWHESAFVLHSDLSEAQRKLLTSGSRDAADDEIFLTCLRLRSGERRAVSEKRSPTYAPTEFAKMLESQRIGKDRLERAMNRLFRAKRIERSLLWRSDGRKEVYGLSEVGAPCA